MNFKSYLVLTASISSLFFPACGPMVAPPIISIQSPSTDAGLGAAILGTAELGYEIISVEPNALKTAKRSVGRKGKKVVWALEVTINGNQISVKAETRQNAEGNINKKVVKYMQKAEATIRHKLEMRDASELEKLGREYDRLKEIKVIQVLAVDNCQEVGLVSATRIWGPFGGGDPVNALRAAHAKLKIEALLKNADYVVQVGTEATPGFGHAKMTYIGTAYKCDDRATPDPKNETRL